MEYLGDPIVRRLMESIDANHAYIAARLKETCTARDGECHGCDWFNPNIDIGCVWRVYGDEPPCDWGIPTNQSEKNIP